MVVVVPDVVLHILNPSTGRWLCESEASLVYIESSRLAKH